jgi:hypothetical protein
MSGHWPGFRSQQTEGESEATESPSDEEPPPEAGIVGEASVAEAGADAGDDTTPSEPAEAADADAGDADEGSVFLSELVRAMQTTAGVERVKLGEDTERRRKEHIDQIRARETAEADRLRELASEDLKAIEAWADGETKRIQREREHRATERQGDLEASLSEHRSRIDREIERVETAIAQYRADVDVFFESLDNETDLMVIAKRAARRPIFPTLQPVGRSEPAAVGVMDPQAAPDPFESWAAKSEADAEAESAAAAGDFSQGQNVRSLFESVPVLRPMAGSGGTVPEETARTGRGRTGLGRHGAETPPSEGG